MHRYLIINLTHLYQIFQDPITTTTRFSRMNFSTKVKSKAAKIEQGFIIVWYLKAQNEKNLLIIYSTLTVTVNVLSY